MERGNEISAGAEGPFVRELSSPIVRVGTQSRGSHPGFLVPGSLESHFLPLFRVVRVLRGSLLQQLVIRQLPLSRRVPVPAPAFCPFGVPISAFLGRQ